MTNDDSDDLPMHAFSHSKYPRERSPISHRDPYDRTTKSTSSTAPWLCFQHHLNLPRKLGRILKYVLVFAFFLLCYGFYQYEPHIELAFYSRKWVTEDIVLPVVPPLGGCFDAERVSPAYNVTSAVYGPKHTEVQAGMAMRFGLDCYELAGTIKETPRVSRPLDLALFHTYWRSDLRKFGERQEAFLKSFFATQDPERTKLVLWSNGDLEGENEVVRTYRERYPARFEQRVVDIPRMAIGTVLEESDLLKIRDKKAWVDGDLIRLLLLWNYGGVWVDMDSLLTRDLEPLLEHEFVTQWDCYDKKYSALNGALMRFRKHSPYLCEAFHTMSQSRPPRSGSTDWGSVLYFKLWRQLVVAGIPPFKILPFCFSDGRSCRMDNRLPDPFAPDHKSGKWTTGLGLEEGGGLDQVLQKVFSVHLHNQWEKAFPPGGWVERLLLKRFDARLEGRMQ